MDETDETHPLAKRIATSVREQIDDQSSSRRDFLNRSALAGGTLLVLGGSTGFALAEEHEDDTAEEMVATFDDVAGTDLDVLGYALTLEHLENAFYNQGMEMFDESAFMEAEALQSFDEEMRQSLFEYVQIVGDHEAAHVDVLSQAMQLLGGEPPEEATYDFGIESVGNFLTLGQVFENTGVAAYAGAAPYIESPDLLGAALSIHSVEARHAAVFNRVNGELPFPNAFDPAMSQDEVLEAVSQFIGSGDGGSETGTSGSGGNESGTSTTTSGGNESA